MCFTGHNSYQGCRFCKINGKLLRSNSHVYYPLPDDIGVSDLPVRKHNEILNNIKEIDNCRTKNHKDKLIQKYGKSFHKLFLKKSYFLMIYHFANRNKGKKYFI
jgi:hypothetical protein